MPLTNRKLRFSSCNGFTGNHTQYFQNFPLTWWTSAECLVSYTLCLCKKNATHLKKYQRIQWQQHNNNNNNNKKPNSFTPERILCWHVSKTGKYGRHIIERNILRLFDWTKIWMRHIIIEEIVDFKCICLIKLNLVNLIGSCLIKRLGN